jgi:hypothetical protein
VDQVRRRDQTSGAYLILSLWLFLLRIFRQLTHNLLNGGSGGGGMSRDQSVEYIAHILSSLKIKDEAPGNIDSENAKDDRFTYDKWISWAVDTICDWPENLFQADSSGDGGGNKADIPNLKTSAPALVQRIGEAAQNLKKYIQGEYNNPAIKKADLIYDQSGLSIEHEIGDAPPIAYEEYIPGEDEWFL